MLHAKTPALAVLVLLTLMLCSACGGGMMSSVKAMQNTWNEEASIEVSLDRIEDLDEGLKQVDTILFETPFDPEAEWVKELPKVDQKRAEALKATVADKPPYNLPNREVPAIKIMRLHNDEILAKAGGSGKHDNVLSAFASLTGDQGAEMLTQYDNVKAIKNEIAGLEGKTAELEAEADIEGTPEARKTEIETEIANIEKEIEAKEAQVAPEEEKLFTQLEALGAVKIGPDTLETAKALFYVIGHIAKMELDAVTTAATVAIQAPLAIPGLPTEMQNLAARWVGDMAKELGGTVDNIGVDLEYPDNIANISMDTIGVKITGTEGLDTEVLKEKLLGQVIKFYDQAISAPGRAASISERVQFQAQFLLALSKAMANMVGATFEEGLPFNFES